MDIYISQLDDDDFLDNDFLDDDFCDDDFLPISYPEQCLFAG